MNQNKYILIGGILVGFIIILGMIWFFFFRSTGQITTDSNSTSDGLFGNPDSTNNTTPASTDVNGTQTINTITTNAQQKIFKITDGPIVGATLIQTLRPTTTLARYIRQDDGHVYDVPLGVAGAVPRIVSNVTIPGGQRAIWVEGGNAVLLQYTDDSLVTKTVYLGFPIATTTSVSQPTRILFLPDNIIDIAASPDGKSLAYLIKTSTGSDGYIGKSDGTSSKKIFSLPLAQMLISWPSQGTILASTKSAVSITGIVFSVSVASGAVNQFVTADGLTAIADQTFSNILYQTNDGTNKNTYIHNTKNNLNTLLGFSPFPEKCMWSELSGSVVYCASPLQTVGISYLDLWHQGLASAGDSIFAFNIQADSSTIVTTPGGKNGGEASDILEMALSPNEHYLSFTTKGARALWGVTIAQ